MKFDVKDKKKSFTLVEMLIVVAIIAVLAAISIGVATRVDNQGKERLTRDTFALLDAALGQFRDYGYNYKSAGQPEIDFYRGLDFPIDCNGYPFNDDGTDFNIETTLKKTLDASNVSPNVGAVHDRSYSGSEMLYFFLSQVPSSRKTLDKIDSSMITSEDDNGNPMTLVINFPNSSKRYPLFRIIDPWGETLRYDYYDEWESDFGDREKTKRTFPVITSAGPDGFFGTVDDITSR